jgi:hypothetical protein
VRSCDNLWQMRWLVTTPADADLAQLREELAAAGAKLDDEAGVPIEAPLGGEAPEAVVSVEGPADLPERLRDSATALEVFPDSEQELFGSGTDRL